MEECIICEDQLRSGEGPICDSCNDKLDNEDNWLLSDEDDDGPTAR
jgi:hypothetical protein